MHEQYFIVNNNLAGGSNKWANDISNNINSNIIRLYKKEQLEDVLENNHNKNIVVIINSFIHTNFTIDIFLKYYYTHRFKIILPIHDWYWFCLGADYSNSIHNSYLDNNLKLSNNTIEFFKICYKIICPTKFVYNIINNFNDNNNLNIVTKGWIDYDLYKNYSKIKISKGNNINIGVLVDLSIYKGKEQCTYLMNRYSNTNILGRHINFFVIGHTIERHKDDIYSYMNVIKKNNIHGLMLLNKWGETWCYSLTKALLSGLPIFYNNNGCFKERIPKNMDKYIINNNNENEYYNVDMLETNFNFFIIYIIKSDIYINNINEFKINNLELISEIKTTNNTLSKNDMKSIFIITSKIIVSNSSLIYTDKRSIYTVEQRVSQTLETIDSIKKYFPNTTIILIDNSKLNYTISNHIKKNVSFFIDRKYINSIKNIDYITDVSPCKGTAEMTQLQIALNFIKSENLHADNIFKISGRYKLVNFDKMKFLNNKIIFKKNNILADRGISDKYYYTCFYKFPLSFLEKMIFISNKFTDIDKGESIILDNKYLGLEEVLPQFIKDSIDPTFFKTVDKLGIEQKISVIPKQKYGNFNTTQFI